ncbi:hypothetical protein [Micromonospora sp. NPDC047527]|uniref:hypothetical protein n=1 Tax=unclassified Micromonospora TaxID=2617518 RepID=UPI0033F72436
MPSANLVHPTRWVTLRSLRELTRLAFTALVLAVGLSGALAATPPPAPTQPSAVSSRVDTLRPEAAPTADHASRPIPSRPADGIVTATAAGPVTAALRHAPSVEPGRGTPPRRGPPTR